MNIKDSVFSVESIYIVAHLRFTECFITYSTACYYSTFPAVTQFTVPLSTIT